MLKEKLLIIVIGVLIACLITHILSHKSRVKNTPKIISNFKTEVEPDLKKSLAHSNLEIGSNNLLAKQAVCSLGIWILQLRYADMKTISEKFGATLLDYNHRLQNPIQECLKDPYRRSMAKIIQRNMQNIKSCRRNIAYHKRITNQRGGSLRFIRIQLKHRFNMLKNMLK